MEVIITSIVFGLLFGSILGHFTTLDLFSKPVSEQETLPQGEFPNDWREKNNNLNAALIQLRRKAEVKDNMTVSRHRNLQLQMNPHFIFNALTGIHMLLLREDKANALRALRKFKNLLLKSWDSALDSPSAVSASSINDEIEFLNDYVELEKKRLNTELNFKISRSQSLNDNYPIPSFLIQHLIENSLWHGINDQSESSVMVDFKAIEKDSLLEISVTDNGRGLNEVKKPNGRKSFGLQILRERLLLISKEAKFEVRNRISERGCISKITIPLYHGIS